MNRRQFLALIGGGAAILTAPIWADPVTWKNEEELERDLLEDFLSPADHGIERKEISGLLKMIQKDGDTIARAIHIGEGYHLTNYHVIDDGMEGLTINAQMPSYRTWGDRPLELVTYDEGADLALLKSPFRRKRGNALIHAPKQNAMVGDTVSYFTAVTGEPKKEDQIQEIYGVDYKDKKTRKKIGRLVIPAGSRILGREGFVLSYDMLTDEERQKFGIYENACMPTSMLAYNGMSGSGVFRKADDGRYGFVGIVSRAVGFKNLIDAPNHPLGPSQMQQVVTYVVKTNPIERMIRGYLANRPKRL